MKKDKGSELLEEYASIVTQMNKLEAIKDVLKAGILKHFEKEGIEKVESELGTFSRVRMTRWVYSKTVKALEEKVSLAKIKEQEKGTAKATVSETLRFNAPKE